MDHAAIRHQLALGALRRSVFFPRLDPAASANIGPSVSDAFLDVRDLAVYVISFHDRHV